MNYGPPESLEMTPLAMFGHMTSILTGNSANGIFHFERTIHDEGETHESRVLRIWAWDGGPDFECIWIEYFTYEQDAFIYWRDDTNEIISEADNDDLNGGINYGPSQVPLARQRWDEIMTDPCAFLRNVMTLRVL